MISVNYSRHLFSDCEMSEAAGKPNFSNPVYVSLSRKQLICTETAKQKSGDRDYLKR